MSDELPHTKDLDLQHHIAGESSVVSDTTTLIFPKSTITASSGEQIILPHQLGNVQALGSSDAITSFAMDDIVVSSSAVSEPSAVASVSHLSDDTGNLEGHGFTLLGDNRGDLMVVASGADTINLDNVGVVQPGTQTITLNLDEATRYLLQHHQGITRAVELPDGTFQLLEQPLVQVEREDGTLEAQTLHIEVLQALQGDLAQQLPAIDAGYHIGEELDGLDETSSVLKVEPSADLGTDEAISGDSVDQTNSIDQTELSTAPVELASNAQVSMGVSTLSVKLETTSYESPPSDGEQPPQSKDTGQQNKEGKKALGKKDKEVKEPDLNSPIPLSDQTVITVKGKKCVLAFDQTTQQVCAYPLKPPPGTKRRGRPRMSEEEKAAAAERKKQEQLSHLAESTAESVSPSEKSTAAETLLALSNVGSDGIRRSKRKRKKAKLFEEYEELEDSGEEEETSFQDNQEKDPDITLNLPDKKKKIMTPKKDTVATPAVFMTTPTPPVKRGRGRPRRYPPPGQQPTPTSIPAVMIPSANGQTMIMTPIQGLQNLQNFRRQLPNLIPKPVADAGAPSVSSGTSTTADGSDANALSLGNDTDTLPLDTSGVLDSNSIIPTALQGDTIPIVGDNTDSSDHGDTIDQPSSNLLNFMTPTTSSEKSKDGQSTEGTDSTPQPTLIQIPDNLLASLGFKKDPVKIGLKASERELEKLKCPKCDFQGYYVQQYRNHIATHGEDIQKCKCCSYLSLDSDELLEHFKEYHPRCICSECGYMAEHAYIIKRHMMRHDTKSCTCHVCGKVYKDMYILKMHIKMVHMPAEILFECNVCSKKFTRKAHLKRHLRIHEPEKPYKCTVCDYRGCERSDISKHMLIHEDPKHICERCGKTFRHIKNKELHVKRHTGQRDYKCGVCDYFGYTFTDIRKHIERKHQDIKTLICDKCNKHFRNEVTLKEHQQTCNVMMIEQVLAIPTSGGGTNQATIQIPTNLGPDGQIILDGHTIAVNKHGTVNMMVAGEQQLALAEGTEEEEEEMEDEEGGINQAMQIIMTESGEEMHIIAHEVLHESAQIVSHAELHSGNQQAQILDQTHQVHDTSAGIHIISADGQVVDQSSHGVAQNNEDIEESKEITDESDKITEHTEEITTFVSHSDDSAMKTEGTEEVEDVEAVVKGEVETP